MHADPHELANLAKDPAHADTSNNSARVGRLARSGPEDRPEWSEPR